MSNPFGFWLNTVLAAINWFAMALWINLGSPGRTALFAAVAGFQAALALVCCFGAPPSKRASR